MFRFAFNTNKIFSTIVPFISPIKSSHAFGTSYSPVSSAIRLYSNAVNDNRPMKVVIGTSDFKKLRLSDNYIDKSEFILAVDNSGNETCINTFPRRFLKSANLDLLKSFYEIEVNKEGNSLPAEKRVNKSLFAGGSIVIDGTSRFLEPLKIAAYPELISNSKYDPYPCSKIL